MTTQSTIQPETMGNARINPAHESHLKEAVEESVYELKGKLARAVDAGKTKAKELKGGIDATIREKPIQSVLIAAGIGAVIGVLIGRRTR
jgi:ElaB/YqjD/DUF883 family membrane-anchored ribosome-binding protein